MTRPSVPVWLLLSLLGLCFGAAPAVGAQEGEYVVKPVAVQELKAVFGQVESRRVVPARARIGGTIREIKVSEGSLVAEGEVIARVVDDKLGLELDAAEARIKGLNSQLANARTEYDRAQQLLSRGITSQSRADQARTQLEVLSNQLSAAESDKAVILQRSSEGDILAPAEGRVLTVPTTLGAVILPGEEVARIASGQYYLRLSLPERHAAEIREGDMVAVGGRGIEATAAANAPVQEGRIAKVYPEIDAGRVIADVDVAGIGDYFVNERTLVTIPVGSRQVLAVPAEALVVRHGIDYVRLAGAEGALDVAVIPGERLNTPQGPLVEILTGLEEGDRVLLPGYAK